MDIRNFRSILAVMESGSLTAAARQLGVSQPALTKSIQRLETQIGVPLFTREAKGMRPTAYAESLCEFARATCIGMEQSIKEIEALKSGTSGFVTIGGPPLIAAHLFPEIIVRTTNAYPNLRVRIIEQIDDLFSSLLEGKFDLLAATVTSEAPRAGLHHMWMFDDYLVVVAKPGHPVTRLKSPRAKDIAGFRWVFSNAGNLHRKRLEKFFDSENVPLPRPVAETSAPELIRSIVVQTDCIALMAKMGAQADLDAGILEHVEINSPFMLRSIGLLWRSTHALSPAAKRVIDIVKMICVERGYNSIPSARS